jgi:transposase
MILIPGLNSVIVMDNCRIHKSPYIQEFIHVADGQITRGVRCEFLPPYSPDYSLIELASLNITFVVMVIMSASH